jgi:hypothetical protein
MNIESLNLSSWPEFIQMIAELERRSSSVPSALYRGQRCADWKLETTLERATGQSSQSIQRYYQVIHSFLPEIQALANRRWDSIWDIHDKEFSDWTGHLFDNLNARRLLNVDYLAYLRHHGFPSPLLDWSASPYIAAFFAFRHADGRSSNDRVAIHIFQEMPAGIKMTGSEHPNIHQLGQACTHQRHFLQQSHYTVCVDGYSVEPKFVSHAAIGSHPVMGDQDRLLKLTLPASLKAEVFAELKRMSIGAGSLFGTEDGHIESMGHSLELAKINWD